MRRVVPVLIVVALVLMGVLNAAVAQPRGGGAGSPTATPIPNLPEIPELPSLDDLANAENLDEIVAALGAVLAEAADTLQTELKPIIDENSPFVQSALAGSLLQAVALVLGVVMLAFPDRIKGFSLAAVGILAGLVLAQTPLGTDFARDIFVDDLSFLVSETGQLIGFGVLGGLAGLLLLTPLTFFALASMGAVAGALLATQVFGSSDPEMIIPFGAVVGFITMSWAMSRGWLLVGLAVGGALMVFALRLNTVWIPLFMLVALFGTLLRSRDRREAMRPKPLQQLDLASGKVDLKRHSHKPSSKDNPISASVAHHSSDSPIQPF